MRDPRTELLILQPTTYCNLDCRYCYLPNRDSRQFMSLETLWATLTNLRDSRLLGDSLSVVWHAGEPLVAPLVFYEQAFTEIERWAASGPTIRQSIQTNGTLIEPAHAELFRRHNVSIGLSVDGPAFIHDAQRTTRSGRPTFDRVIRGLEVLKRHDVVFNVITVLTDASLDYPVEMYSFYVQNEIPLVGFNIDEIEGINSDSSFQREGARERYRSFMRTFYQLVREENRLAVREFKGLESLIRSAHTLTSNNQVEPLAILSVGVNGDYGTFSPELLDLEDPKYGTFRLGNVKTGLIRQTIRTPHALALFEDVAAGVEMCKQQCPYFGLCGGGAPSNKLFENGTFRSSETLFCRMTLQFLADILMECMEEELGLPTEIAT